MQANELSKNFESGLVDRVISQVEDSLQGMVAKPSRAKWFLMGAALGSLAVIFLDPVNGEKRRAAVKDTVTKWGTDGFQFGKEQFDNLKTRAQDVASTVQDTVNQNTQH